jgi:hypothetical protein
LLGEQIDFASHVMPSAPWRGLLLGTARRPRDVGPPRGRCLLPQ